MAVDFNYPYQIVADSPAVAAEIQDNFNDLLSWIKTYYRQIDDTPKLTVMPELPGNPTQPNHPVPLSYLSALFPVGFVVPYAGGPTDSTSAAAESSVIPDGWAICDGSSKSTTGEFADLFAVIGYRYGGGGGSFNLPNLNTKVMVGREAGGDFGTVGSTGGSPDPVLIEHTHPMNHGHTASASNLNHTHSTPAHTHDAQIQHVKWRNRQIDSGGGTDIVIAQENLGDSNVQWSTVGIRQNAASGGGTTGNPIGFSPTVAVQDYSGHTDKQGDIPDPNSNYQPYVVMNYLIKK